MDSTGLNCDLIANITRLVFDKTDRTAYTFPVKAPLYY